MLFSLILMEGRLNTFNKELKAPLSILDLKQFLQELVMSTSKNLLYQYRLTATIFKTNAIKYSFASNQAASALINHMFCH